ncbi:MAG: hypothetical protein A2161_19050 [Candidatus Schekmanbacteria bacterium RBG_13_48_7]|uniref:Uncharacterized protein n=1 Tax=Candidatus Schekmanbacteria bacterium RBG_13_48_7 TaxID=1817878 RepID=A0A1F7RQL8_9BACT|nr:MAG: hypothetical protein A2161_19050 [Candidatus Schekmanbacteria bacterium RBG_13_48_7]
MKFSLKQLFGFKKKITINDIATEDIIREKTQLDYEKKKLVTGIQKGEQRKQQLVLQGAKASSNSERLTLAHEIKTEDKRIKGLLKTQIVLNQRLLALNGLEVIKRNQEILSNTSKGILEKLDIDTLANNIDKIVVGDQINLDKLSRLAEMITAPLEGQDEMEQDGQINEIMALMETMSQTPEKEVNIKSEIDKILQKSSNPDDF